MDYVLFVVLAPLAAAALASAILSALPRRHLPAAGPLLATGGCIAGWLLFNTAEVLAPTHDAKLFWARATYVFVTAAPLCWLSFALIYTDHREWMRRRRLALLSLVPALTLALVFTNEAHGLIWRSHHFYPISVPRTDLLPSTLLGLGVSHGAGYWLFAAYSYGCLLASSVLIIRDHLSSFSIYRRRSRWLVLATVFPLAFNAVYLTGLVPGVRKDFTPLAFAFGTMVFTVVIRRYGMLDLKPVARKLLIDKLRDSMLVLDASDRVVDYNPEAAVVLGFGDGAIGRGVRSALRPEHHALALYLDGPQEESVELSLPAGSAPRYYELHTTPLASETGALTGRLLVLYDITERKDHLESLREANLKLIGEYEGMDAFSRTVAHDLKNPVHTILGFSALLEEDYDGMPDELRREALQAVRRTAEKMEQIIRELLLLASVRRHPVDVQRFGMGDVVSNVQERLRPLVEQCGGLVVAPDTWPAALGHAPWVEEVWTNYMSNALKYAGPQPQVELGWTCLEDGTARFWVKDSGPGIPPEQQARLFVPFSRLGGQQAEGHGLGLSIVRRIMEALGGEFGVESSGRAGEGSTFNFTLPLAGAGPAPTTAAQDVATPCGNLCE